MWFKWFIIGAQILGAMISVNQIGKPRRTLTATDGAVTVAITALIIWGLLVYWK